MAWGYQCWVCSGIEARFGDSSPERCSEEVLWDGLLLIYVHTIVYILDDTNYKGVVILGIIVWRWHIWGFK